MAQIYAKTTFALIVATGEYMNTPIPGVSQDRAQPPDPVDSPWKSLASTKWRTRAWTYQESILPRRKLYIMDNQVWFECQEAIMYESLSAAHFRREKILHKVGNTNGPDHSTDGVSKQNGNTQWEDYKRHLSAYSVLSLSSATDIFNAFDGITNALYGSKSTTFGLPFVDFEKAILWDVFVREDRDEKASHDIRKANDVIIPSWSWASIRGHISIKRKSYAFFAVNAPVVSGALVNWLEFDKTDTCPRILVLGV
ncbi:hypothetical protein NA57DRAFT_82200 [Rhizodiscina lignyota]|uniref:Heterokaryon incompatibility domain-containing protein n=1 Tax=Rhizodiscina lignyota TaxID=1504668 RepID=A0A9P4M0N3_9PEZI|nr:hypothetical protein NA57DRAFT_82200 [Rhizodiscina lignyota]